jgi:enoyl-[acyl-carrier-protein] reductase (NADH)
VAERLAAPGVDILVTYLRDEDAARATVSSLEQQGASALAAKIDSCSLDGAHELADRARERLGGVDALVHCAVWTTTAPAMTIDPQIYRESLERNGCSLLWLAQAFDLLLQHGSSIIFLTSRGSIQAVPNYVALGTAKALAESIVRYLAAELAPRGVRVNSISSGPVNTEALRAVMPGAEEMLEAVSLRSPSRRELKPADVANVVALLLSPDAQMIQGERVSVDGGLRLV